MLIIVIPDSGFASSLRHDNKFVWHYKNSSLALILNIETATEVCSTALADDGKLLALEEETKANSHSSVLTILIQRLFEKSGKELDNLDAIAVSEGPGSYTGLRIGVSAAKGLCYAINKPLIAVPTLQAMAWGAVRQVNDASALYCPVLSSVKDEVFAALYDAALNEIAAPASCDADLRTFLGFFGNKTVFLSGEGVKKIRLAEKMRKLHLPNSSQFMIELSERCFSEKKFCSLAYFEPLYLKNFIAKKTNFLFTLLP
ncbi:MAG TPA: tRNA (adenosine(37)-N6)-threonylcarbamoyltransferase complex dimerization subunit type 1 TsaB [Chitinophagales bacterium]|nr:tRNA (adenosine(37)-N6)-threonylcarbamoyltransferase complex dimerization subunit type 1 TsaB [Chitinophagales bacterium]